MRKSFFIVPFAIALSACASSSKTAYMAADGPGEYGYYASALEDNRYRVAYKVRGNDTSTAKDYALLRAAELTLQNGYDWFEVVDRDTEREDTYANKASTHMRVSATTYRECGLLGCTTVTRPAYVDTTYNDNLGRQQPESTVTFIEVVMGKGTEPNGGNVYNANNLIATLRS